MGNKNKTIVLDPSIRKLQSISPKRFCKAHHPLRKNSVSIWCRRAIVALNCQASAWNVTIEDVLVTRWEIWWKFEGGLHGLYKRNRSVYLMHVGTYLWMYLRNSQVPNISYDINIVLNIITTQLRPIQLPLGKILIYSRALIDRSFRKALRVEMGNYRFRELDSRVVFF